MENKKLTKKEINELLEFVFANPPKELTIVADSFKKWITKEQK